MRVLLAHNYYRSVAPSGEDAVFKNERDLLQQRGIDVVPFERFSDDIDATTVAQRTRLALDTAWSKTTYRNMNALIRRTRPDVAHFHNTFPLISPSAYAACQDNGVPVVQTLHNFRLICASALLQRDDHVCEDCVGTSLMLPALRYRCYRDSRAATAGIIWMLVRNRLHGTYRRLVNRYIALTQFAAGRLIAGGLPSNRLRVKPNFLSSLPLQREGGGGGYAVFVGRLSKEKGVRVLVSAWGRVQGLRLKILGDGPLRAELEELAARHEAPVEFLGYRSRDEVLDIVAQADIQVVPSEWYEAFPMVVLEAYACGTPVVASRIGSLAEIVIEGETGVLFEPGNPVDLADKVNLLWGDRAELPAYRHRIRAHFLARYTADLNYAMLMKIYAEAISDSEQVRSAHE
jgi:glycosyltransferase involved in cell wall biosynthesis